LKLEKNYVAGFNNPIVKNDDSWTLFVDIDACTISNRSGLI